jgi:hypothetical protein
VQGRRRRQEDRRRDAWSLVGGSKRRAAFYILFWAGAGDDWPGLVVPRPANVVRSIPRRRLGFLVCERPYKSIETFPYIIYSIYRLIPQNNSNRSKKSTFMCSNNTKEQLLHLVTSRAVRWNRSFNFRINCAAPAKSYGCQRRWRRVGLSALCWPLTTRLGTGSCESTGISGSQTHVQSHYANRLLDLADGLGTSRWCDLTTLQKFYYRLSMYHVSPTMNGHKIISQKLALSVRFMSLCCFVSDPSAIDLYPYNT